MQSSFTFTAIGHVHSCFDEKFGIPRQAGLTPSATASIILTPPYNDPGTIEELKAFSHIWVVFVFHKHLGAEWKPKVRPPRLGGNQRIGVFASRASYRPNPIGMSAVKLEGIDTHMQTRLLISGHDLLDGTPVLDIKPYITYADSIESANSDYASMAPETPFSVQFEPQAQQTMAQHPEHPRLQRLIEEVLRLDPRPAYHRETRSEAEYGMKISGFDVKFRVLGNLILVKSIG